MVIDRICWGRPFHSLAAAYLKDIQLYVSVLVQGPINCSVLLDWRGLGGTFDWIHVAWSNAQ